MNRVLGETREFHNKICFFGVAAWGLLSSPGVTVPLIGTDPAAHGVSAAEYRNR